MTALTHMARLLALASLRAAYDPDQPRDEDGKWTTVYHGTSTASAKAILETGFKTRTGQNGALLGEGVYFTSRRHQAEGYGETIVEVELNDLRVKDFATERAYKLYLKNRVTDWEASSMSKAMSEAGYDAVRINKDIVVVFDAGKAKPKLRSAASALRPVRTAADQGERKILLAVRTAAAIASRVSPAKMADAFAASLRRTLPGALARVALAGAEAAGEMRVAYDPSQPRDEDGKWTAVGPRITGPFNRKFSKALDFIKTTSPDLLGLIPAIHFVEGKGPGKRAQFAPSTKEINVWERSKSETVGSYVETLVHELTHAKQQSEGKPFVEVDATIAGRTARWKFEGLEDFRALKSRDPLSAAASAWAKKHTAELVTGIAETTRKRIAAVVAKQLPDKKTHTALVQILKDPKRAQLIARTESMIAAHQGQHLVWAQAVEDGLLDADFKRRWIFTDDEVGCPQCEALDGKLAEAEGEYEPGVSMPPAHPNCLLPGAEVSGRIVAGLEARYSGPAIEVKTLRGNTLRVTPNHQILTSEGWVAASELRQGMQLFSDQGDRRNGASFGKIDDYQRPALVEDIIQALRLRGFTTAKPSRLDLHGDARWVDGEVDVVGANRELRQNVQPARSQESDDFRFPLTDSFEPDVRGVGTSNLHLERVLLPAPSEPTSLHLSDDLSVVGLQQTPLDPLLLGRSSKWDVCSFEGVRQDVAANAAFLGELQKRSAGQIAGDEIVEVRNFEFSGQVYELQSEVGWIIAQNIVISNCRCTEGLSL